MGAATIEQMANRVAGLIEDRLHIRGDGLKEKIRKAGRRLPAKVLTEARFLETAALQARNPKLLMQIDEARVAQAYDVCVKYLTSVNPGAIRRAAILGRLTAIVFYLLIVAVLVFAVLYLRGFIGIEAQP